MAIVVSAALARLGWDGRSGHQARYPPDADQQANCQEKPCTTGPELAFHLAGQLATRMIDDGETVSANQCQPERRDELGKQTVESE